MTTPSAKYNKAQLEKMAESVDFWWHSIDLGQGVVTKGAKTPETLQHELESLRLPDLRDKTVLDIGAWDGFFSFEAERRGARHVVALDHGSLDNFLGRARSAVGQETPNWQTRQAAPDTTPPIGPWTVRSKPWSMIS